MDSHRVTKKLLGQSSTLNQYKINLEILRTNPFYKTLSESYEDVGKKKKCTIKYTYISTKHVEIACGNDKNEAKMLTVDRIVQMIQHFNRCDTQALNESSSSSSNDLALSAELVYDSLKGCIIRCQARSLGGLEHGLYYVDGVEPKAIKREHLQLIKSYRDAEMASKHPWLYILMLFGNNIQTHKKSYYYVLCGDNFDAEYMSVASTIEELKF